MKRRTKQTSATTTAERPMTAKAPVMGIALLVASRKSTVERRQSGGRVTKQTSATTTAERLKAAKAQVVGVGPHDN